MPRIDERYFPDEEKITRHGFVSHMKKYMKELLESPTKARPDQYLEKYGIDWKVAQEMLLTPTDKSDPESAVMRKEKKIIAGPDGKDRFQVKYVLPRKDFKKKMNRLFIDRFDKNVISELKLNEEGEGGAGIAGATNAESSGQFVQPLFGKPIKRKTLYITQEQAEHLSEAVEMDTIHGDFGYDHPGLDTSGDFYKEANDHKNIMRKSWKN